MQIVSATGWGGFFLRLAGVLALSGAVHAGAAQTPATVVWFQEQEAGIAPYPVRYIVTPDFMRSDDGRDDGDFLLFDRRQRKIYSVVHEDRRVLEIDGKGAPPEKPGSLQFKIRQHSATQAPKIAGAAALEVELSAGGEICRTALVAPGFLEPVRRALQEFALALAVQQQRTLAHTPEQRQTPCFLSRYLYATDFQLSRGMLLADWNSDGERRQLTGFKAAVPVDETLFVVPAGFSVLPGAAH